MGVYRRLDYINWYIPNSATYLNLMYTIIIPTRVLRHTTSQEILSRHIRLLETSVFDKGNDSSCGQSDVQILQKDGQNDLTCVIIRRHAPASPEQLNIATIEERIHS